jgi:hypothetical protein
MQYISVIYFPWDIEKLNSISGKERIVLSIITDCQPEEVFPAGQNYSNLFFPN